MKLRSTFAFVVLALTATGLLGCGGGGESRSTVLRAPIDIGHSSVDIAFDGRITRFVYLADQVAGHVAVIDQDQEKIIDTNASDDFDKSPVIVGGELTALAIQDLETAPRVFVADTFYRQIHAFEAMPPTDPSSDELRHVPVALGDTAVARASQPLFENKGRLSSPSLSNVVVNADTVQNEHWEVKYEGSDKGYKVTGSLSGEQAVYAVEDEHFVSDNGAISFTVISGGERTTKGDRFRFGTVRSQPLNLTGKPIDLEISGNRLLVVTNDPPQLLAVDLDTFAITETIDLDDGSGTEARLGSAAVGNGHIYLPNAAKPTAFDINMEDFSFSTLSTGIESRAVGLDDVTQTLYLIPTDIREVQLWSLENNLLQNEIDLNEIGYAFAPFTMNELTFGLIPLASGGVQVIDIANQSRIDSNVTGGDTQSDSVAQEFFDAGAISQPTLVSVNTLDGVTRTERWQLFYEGVLFTSGLSEAAISETTLSWGGATFVTDGIQAGDVVVLSPGGSAEEIAVESVLTEETLLLARAPSMGEDQPIEVRSAGTYVVIGSTSGRQNGRVTEGIPYTSDDQAISLTIRPSITRATTRGDFFTFLTVDGIDPISTSAKRTGRALTVFTRPGESEPTAYVVQQGSGAVSVLDLNRLRERKTIR